VGWVGREDDSAGICSPTARSERIGAKEKPPGSLSGGVVQQRVMGVEPTTFTLATARESTLTPANTTQITHAKTACTPACTPPVSVEKRRDPVAEAMLVIAKLPLSPAEKAAAIRRLLAE